MAQKKSAGVEAGASHENKVPLQSDPGANFAETGVGFQVNSYAAIPASIQDLIEDPALLAFDLYEPLGLKLCAIPLGSKGPNNTGWHVRPATRQQCAGMGLGVLHAHSRTCALDVDDRKAATDWLSARSIDLDRLLAADDAVQIQSGKANRAKLLYRLPPGVGPLPTRKLHENSKTMLEFRCASSDGDSLQDALPPTIHPEIGKPYLWAGRGDVAHLPELPSALLELWRELTTARPLDGHHSASVAPTDPAALAALVDDLHSALALLDPDDYDEWIGVGLALKTLGEEGRELWLDWSQQSAKWHAGDEDKWAGFHTRTTSYASVFAKAQAKGRINPGSGGAEGSADDFEVLDVHGDETASDAAPAKGLHPLAKFIDIGREPTPPRWVIPGFVAHGVVVIAGAHGLGKTTALLPLSMVAAGLHAAGDLLAPRHWRHVIYITEDSEQARRIVAGMVSHGGLGLDAGTVRERLHIVDAARMLPAQVARVGRFYRVELSRCVDGVELLPLVVIDTMAATIELESENDNSQASAMMATMKQGFAGLPLWMVGHVSKAEKQVKGGPVTVRGGSAFEADANQVLYLVESVGVKRELKRGKTRFEAKYEALQIDSQTATITTLDEYGNDELLTMRWGIATPKTNHVQLAEDSAEQAAAADDAAMRREIQDVVQAGWESGTPLSKTGARDACKGNATKKSACIEALITERYLYLANVPSMQRANPSRSAFLVALTDAERAHFLATGEPPKHKTKPPESWLKPAKQP